MAGQGIGDEILERPAGDIHPNYPGAASNDFLNLARGQDCAALLPVPYPLFYRPVD